MHLYTIHFTQYHSDWETFVHYLRIHVNILITTFIYFSSALLCTNEHTFWLNYTVSVCIVQREYRQRTKDKIGLCAQCTNCALLMFSMCAALTPCALYLLDVRSSRSMHSSRDWRKTLDFWKLKNVSHSFFSNAAMAGANTWLSLAPGKLKAHCIQLSFIVYIESTRSASSILSGQYPLLLPSIIYGKAGVLSYWSTNMGQLAWHY